MERVLLQPASQKSKDLNKVTLLLQDLDRSIPKNFPSPTLNKGEETEAETETESETPLPPLAEPEVRLM